MTRTAVEDGFAYFLDEAIETTLEEFRVARVLRNGTRDPTGAVVDSLLKNSESLHRRVVQPELETYRTRTLGQFGVMLDYVASNEPLEEHRQEVLKAGAVANSIRGDISRERQQAVRESLLTRHRELGEAVEPLLTSPESDFWTAAVTELTREEAEQLVSEQFPFTGPLRRHRDAFEMVATIDISAIVGGVARILPTSSVDVEYTGEAIRAMYRAEQSVVHAAETEIDRRFD